MRSAGRGSPPEHEPPVPRLWACMGSRHGRHCAFALHVHLVFVAKYNRKEKVFDGGAIQRLKVMFEKVCSDFEAQLVEKGVPDAHWGMFEQLYGGDGGTYLLLSAPKSLAEIDKGFAEGKQFESAMGEDGMKKLNELFASCVESTQQQLLAFNPHMSYVKDEWIKADPDFWNPKTAAATAKAPAERKAKP